MGLSVKLNLCLIVSCLLTTCLSAPELRGIRAEGNRLVNYRKEEINIKGLNHAGTEYMCVQGNGIFDGPYNNSLVNSFKAWKANAVRVPLNEDCWLNINGIDPRYAGQNYIDNIVSYVNMFTNEGFAVILDLHWSAPGSQKADGQQPMPDHDHSYTFWQSVARTFSGNDKVIFELFNEPFPDNNNWNSPEAWRCWRDGGTCNGVNYEAVGMQTLVYGVRQTGAKNLILLGGIAYSNSLAQWINYAPQDPANNTGAALHVYNFNYCVNEDCWNQYVAPVAAKYPVVATEIGENDCSGGFVTSLMKWLDEHAGGHYLPWTFNTWDCKSGPALISSYNGTGVPTSYGQAVKNYYASFN